MRILADVHVSPITVSFLRTLGHDAIRVSSVLPPTASDGEIIAKALEEDRVIITQDMDFPTLIALSGRKGPSLISLRLSSSRLEHVHAVLESILPLVEEDVLRGAIITLDGYRIRRRSLPIVE